MVRKPLPRGMPFTSTSPSRLPPRGSLPARALSKLVFPLPVGPAPGSGLHLLGSWCGRGAAGQLDTLGLQDA
jgi:hypothetical protein